MQKINFYLFFCCEMEMQEWYMNLMKPDWAPATWVFGVVWSILYVFIASSFLYTVVLYRRGKVSWFLLSLFVVNLIANLSYTYLQFTLKNMLLSTIDILVVLISSIVFALLVWRDSKIIALAQIPYIIWVCIATVLQLSIFILNM